MGSRGGRVDGTFSQDIERGLAVLPRPYRELLHRARRVFADDERVRAMWIHGAMARGAADAGSDLDIDIAVRDEDFEAFTSTWTDWLSEISPTVSAIQLPGMPGSFYALTPGCERLDVITERVSAISTSPLARRLEVFDRDGLTADVPEPSDPLPDPGAMRYFIEETLRQAANFPVVVVREDWLLGVVAVQQLHQYLYLLFAEANKPQPPTGPKQWSFKLDSRRRALLEALPVPQPRPDSVLEARHAALTLMLTEGRQIAETHGVVWPDELAQAVLGYLRREGHGVDLQGSATPGS
jgi:hypothetical protein